jgi:glycosyltransferase involved in cell wall biosynthesis
VIGETFQDMPEVFEQAKVLFAGLIDRWGYQADRSEYESALSEADVVVSTADHEFFGISVIEAISAGAYPVLPKRLAYPEIVAAIETVNPDEFFYTKQANSLAARLTELAKHLEDNAKSSLWGTDSQRGQRGVQQFDWKRLSSVLDDAMEQIADLT